MFESSSPLFHAQKYDDPQRVLEAVFGYREFRPGQRRIIDAVLAGRDCIAVAISFGGWAVCGRPLALRARLAAGVLLSGAAPGAGPTWSPRSLVLQAIFRAQGTRL